MNTMTSCRWVVTLSLVATAPFLNAVQGYSQPGGSSGGSGSTGAAAGGSQGMSKPGASKNSKPEGTTQSTGPTGRSNQTQNQPPPDRIQALENRLREGHMDQPIAQGQISDRLDQFYRGSETVAGGPAAGPSGR